MEECRGERNPGGREEMMCSKAITDARPVTDANPPLLVQCWTRSFETSIDLCHHIPCLEPVHPFLSISLLLEPLTWQCSFSCLHVKLFKFPAAPRPAELVRLYRPLCPRGYAGECSLIMLKRLFSRAVLDEEADQTVTFEIGDCL